MQTSNNIMTAKVFRNGRSQAVRIPAEYRFDAEEVFINKIGDTLLLTPKSSLAKALKQGADLISKDFMNDGRPDEIGVSREAL